MLRCAAHGTKRQKGQGCTNLPPCLAAWHCRCCHCNLTLVPATAITVHWLHHCALVALRCINCLTVRWLPDPLQVVVPDALPSNAASFETSTDMAAAREEAAAAAAAAKAKAAEAEAAASSSTRPVSTQPKATAEVGPGCRGLLGWDQGVGGRWGGTRGSGVAGAGPGCRPHAVESC